MKKWFRWPIVVFEIILVLLLLLDVFGSDSSKGKLDVNILFKDNMSGSIKILNNTGGPVYNLTVYHQAPIGYAFKYGTQYFIRDSLTDGQSVLKDIQLEESEDKVRSTHKLFKHHYNVFVILGLVFVLFIVFKVRKNRVKLFYVSFLFILLFYWGIRNIE